MTYHTQVIYLFKHKRAYDDNDMELIMKNHIRLCERSFVIILNVNQRVGTHFIVHFAKHISLRQELVLC